MAGWIEDTLGWWAGLQPEWMFLFALPFAVAAAALIAHREPRQPRAASARKRKPAPPHTPRPHANAGK